MLETAGISERESITRGLRVEHPQYYLGGIRTSTISYFLKNLEQYPDLAAESLAGLKRVAEFSREGKHGFRTEEVTIPDKYLPKLVPVVHEQPENMRSFSKEIVENRILFEKAGATLPYAEVTTEKNGLGEAVQISIPGINADLFDMAIAAHIRNLTGFRSQKHVTLHIPKLADDYQERDTISLTREERYDEDIGTGLALNSTGMLFLTVSTDAVRQYYREHKSRIDKYAPAFEALANRKEYSKTIWKPSYEDKLRSVTGGLFARYEHPIDLTKAVQIENGEIGNWQLKRIEDGSLLVSSHF